MKIRTTLLLLLVLFAINLYSNNEILFEENKGQWNSKVLFKSDITGGSLFLERNCLTYNFVNVKDMDNIHYMNHHPEIYSQWEIDRTKIRYHAYKVNFLNSLPENSIETRDIQSYYTNYFIGNDPSKWASEVRSYGHVTYNQLYDGIDINIYSKKGNLKYDYIVHPGADISQLVMEYEGIDNMYIKDGSLYIITSVNEIIEQKPYAYQDINGTRSEVRCDFVITEGNRISFALPEGYKRGYSYVYDVDEETGKVYHGWDGTIKNRGIGETAVYGWLVIYRDVTGAEHERAGLVTLIR